MTKNIKIDRTQVVVAAIGLLGVIIPLMFQYDILPWPHPTPTVTPLPTVSPTPDVLPLASLKVLSFYDQSYRTEDEYPGVPFDTQSHVRVTGKTEFVKGYGQYVWYAICPQTTKKCTLTEIKLDAAGAWNIFIDIGDEENKCAVFDVIFVVVKEAANETFKNFDEPYSLSQDSFKRQSFEVHIPFAVRPVLDASNRLTSICQTASR